MKKILLSVVLAIVIGVVSGYLSNSFVNGVSSYCYCVATSLKKTAGHELGKQEKRIYYGCHLAAGKIPAVVKETVVGFSCCGCCLERMQDVQSCRLERERRTRGMNKKIIKNKVCNLHTLFLWS